MLAKTVNCYVIFGFRNERFMCWSLVLTIIIISGWHYMYIVHIGQNDPICWLLILLLFGFGARIRNFLNEMDSILLHFLHFFLYFPFFRNQSVYSIVLRWISKILVEYDVVKFKLYAIVTRISMNKICWFLFYFMMRSRMWIALKISTQYAWMPNFKL